MRITLTPALWSESLNARDAGYYDLLCCPIALALLLATDKQWLVGYEKARRKHTNRFRLLSRAALRWRAKFDNGDPGPKRKVTLEAFEEES